MPCFVSIKAEIASLELEAVSTIQPKIPNAIISIKHYVLLQQLSYRRLETKQNDPYL